MDSEALQCQQCGCKKFEKEFFQYQGSNKRFNICKDCLHSQFDPDDFSTFLWIFKELDVPFIEDEWEDVVKCCRSHEDLGEKKCLGKYLARMRLFGFKNFRWKDSTEFARYLSLSDDSYLKLINGIISGKEMDTLQCKKCSCKKAENEFFQYQGLDKRFNICKECLYSQLDIYNPDTFLWILKELDIPFIKHEWDVVVRYYGNKALDVYIAEMRLTAYEEFKWKDSIF